MKRPDYKFPALAGAMLFPFMARANMNGGLHIPDWVIGLAIFLLLLFVVSILSSIWNVWYKSRRIRIFNMIVWLPLMALGVLTLRAGTAGVVILVFPLLQIPLMLASVAKKTPNPDENEL